MKIQTNLEKIKADDNAIRLDRWFKRHHKELSFAWVAKNVRKGLIRVNGKKVDISYKIMVNDSISYPNFASENLNINIIKVTKGNPEKAKLLLESVLFKNDDFLVINKPAGLAVQGGTKINDSVDSLAEFLKFEYDEKPKLVHRIDKETSGILILARKTNVAAKFAEMFRGKDLNKKYLALLNGVPNPRIGKIDVPLEKLNLDNFEKMEKSVKGKKAVTNYKVIDYATDKFALVELTLLTGRTHQLRAHMAYIECPIIGDGKYGKRLGLGNLINNKLYLHAHKIEFVFNDKQYQFTAPLPLHFKDTLNNLGLHVE